MRSSNQQALNSLKALQARKSCAQRLPNQRAAIALCKRQSGRASRSCPLSPFCAPPLQVQRRRRREKGRPSDARSQSAPQSLPTINSPPARAGRNCSITHKRASKLINLADKRRWAARESLSRSLSRSCPIVESLRASRRIAFECAMCSRAHCVSASRRLASLAPDRSQVAVAKTCEPLGRTNGRAVAAEAAKAAARPLWLPSGRKSIAWLVASRSSSVALLLNLCRRSAARRRKRLAPSPRRARSSSGE